MRFTVALPLTLIFFTLILSHTTHAQESTVQFNSTADERLNQAITEQQLSLDDATLNTTRQKCQFSQTILSDMAQNSDSLIRKRVELYSSLQKELIAIQLRMARQGADASEIDLLSGKLQQGLDEFTLAADAYGASLNDVVIVNCISKPLEFRAGLIVMRAQRAQVLKRATELKNDILSAPLTTFEPLKKRLVF